MEATQRETHQRLRLALIELEKNPAWVDLIRPKLEAMQQEEAAAHEDEKKTPEERAEHLFSMKRLRDLPGIVGEELVRVNRWLASHPET